MTRTLSASAGVSDIVLVVVADGVDEVVIEVDVEATSCDEIAGGLHSQHSGPTSP